MTTAPTTRNSPPRRQPRHRGHRLRGRLDRADGRDLRAHPLDGVDVGGAVRSDRQLQPGGARRGCSGRPLRPPPCDDRLRAGCRRVRRGDGGRAARPGCWSVWPRWWGWPRRRSCRRRALPCPTWSPHDRLEWANSTLAVGRNVGQLLGPLVGGVAAAAVGSAAVFGISAVGLPDLGRAGGVGVRPILGQARRAPRSPAAGRVRVRLELTGAARHDGGLDGAAVPAGPGAGGRAAAGARVRPGRRRLRHDRRLLGRRSDRGLLPGSRDRRAGGRAGR